MKRREEKIKQILSSSISIVANFFERKMFLQRRTTLIANFLIFYEWNFNDML
jgi:hypothetical protein